MLPLTLQLLDPGLGHLKHVLSQVFHTLHDRLSLKPFLADLIGQHALRGPQLAGYEGQLVRTLEEQLKGFAKLVAGLEDGAAAEDVQTETGAGEGDGKTADVAEVADARGAG